ncbi:MAG: class I SAM-dependent methyltransferase [Acidobacteria bacterium]|nr:class I SAM-dependent methyltransferase [Acidobacteriota bacterium]
MEKVFFVCPFCRQELRQIENVFSCLKCQKRFVKINSVYDFSNIELKEEARKTVEQFGKSWEIFSHIEDYHKKQFLEWIYPLQEEDFKDKVVLEAGCGKGRHTVIVSSFKPKHLFSVDLSEAIFIAEKAINGIFIKSEDNNKTVSEDGAFQSTSPEKDGKKNITLVRTDLKKLPFADEYFDLIFCVGVLHHIDNMEEALNELWRVLKPNGKLGLWVYGKEGNFWIIYFLNPIRKFITSRISANILRFFSFPLSLFLYLILKTIYGPITRWGNKDSSLYYSSYLGSISPYPFKEIENIVVDHLCPPIAHYLSRDEVEKMVTPLNPADVKYRWHHKNSWTIVLIK